MRCPSCGQDADPANALCPHCHAALHIPAAPSSPYAGGPPQYNQPPPRYNQPPQYEYSEPQYAPPPTQHYGAQPPTSAPPDYGWPSGNYQILEPGAPPERSRSPWIWVVVVIAVLLVGAGAAIAAVKLTAKHTGGTGVGAQPPGASTTRPAATSGAATADGKAQAQAIDQLLNASSASRQKLGPALTAVDGCGDLNGAVTTLQQVTTERDGQVKQGQGLAVDQLNGGAQLKSALVQALTFSLQADQKFTAWAQAVAAAGCSGHAPHEDNYAAAQAASGSATTNKQQFVALWNPVAATYGLVSRSESTV
jgi:hypothetical protein